MIEPPFSPQTLAKRWDCSPQKIRTMVDDGKLPYFRIGAKMIRIPAAEVEKFECDNLMRERKPKPESHGESESIGENTSQSGIDQEENPRLESRLGRTIVGLPKLSLVVSGTPTTNR